jgi:phosphate transport system protein
MKHYEQRLETDVANIREHVDAMATSVIKAIKDSVQALLTGDEKLASEVILADGPVNRAMREIDAMCHSFFAVHLPSGKHLRLVSSIIRINITLERIGDYAVTIARELIQLSKKPSGSLAEGIERMSEHSMDILSQAVESFKRDDADLAKQTMKLTQHTVRHFDEVLQYLVKAQDQREVTELFALFIVFHHLVRVSDQAKNICEDVVFTETGETKAKKVYKILFVDEDDSCLTHMARAIGKKSRRTPAAELHPGLAEFMDQRGVDFNGSKPKSIKDVADTLDDYHVIVSLKGAARSYIDHVPFHTTLLEWDVGEAPAEGDTGFNEALDDAYRSLALQINDLMLLLRGDESSGN